MGFYLQQSSSEDPSCAVGPRCMNAFREAGSFSPSPPPSHALSQGRTDLGEVCLLAVLSILSCPYMLPRIKTKGRSCYRLQMHQNGIGTTQTMGSRRDQTSGDSGGDVDVQARCCRDERSFPSLFHRLCCGRINPEQQGKHLTAWRGVGRRGKGRNGSQVPLSSSAGHRLKPC